MENNLLPNAAVVREISSGIIVFRKERNDIRFLFLYAGGNFWTFPKGKIEKEERSFEAAIRETMEEAGITKKDLSFVNGFVTHENWIFSRGGKKISKTVKFYLAETKKKYIRVSREHLGYGWFSYKEAVKMLVGPKQEENRKALRRAYNFIAKR